MKILNLGLTVLLAFLLAACAHQNTSAGDDAIAIVGATVLPMDGSGAIHEGVVIVRGDRIIAVGASEKVAVPSGARMIDASGRFLVPGLVDMHTHLPPEPGAKGDATWRQLRMMVANGITTARSMAGHPSHPAIRDAIVAEQRIAPVLYVAAPAMHKGNTPDAKTAREKVRAAKAAGFDLIKSHHLDDKTTWQAVQDEARALGMPVAGHLASAIPLEAALRAGQQIEHLDGWFAALLPDDSPARGIPFGQVPPPAVMDAIEVNRIDAIAAKAAALDGWHVPTLALFEKIADTASTNAELRAQPGMQYVPEATLDQWAAQRDHLLGLGLMQAIGSRFVETRRAIVRALHEAGAPLMAGSDTQQAFHLSGFALHEELAALQRAGLPPLAALAAATRVPRDYFRSLPANGSAHGLPADFGVIQPGVRADLLLLDADPSQDVNATREIEAVMLRGRWLDRAALDGILREVAASVASSTAAAAAGEVLLIRHAEAAGHAGDPALSAAGRQRAQAFAARRAAAFAPATVYVTATRRATQTGEIIAQATGAELAVYDPARLDALAATLRASGGRSIVVGHSNTTPMLASLLGGNAGSPIAADEYDRVYRIDLADGRTRIERPSLGARIEDCVLPGVAPPVRCGVVAVPETAAPGARMLDIHFALLESPADDAPPLLIAPGGPGLGGVQSAAGIAQLFAPFRETRDILLFDQRGTGQSNRLDCKLPKDLAGAMASLSAQDEEDVIACRNALAQHADLRAYTTPRAVADLDVIRRALGVARMDIFGMSYGTRIATEYARQFPGHVRNIVIRAPAPPALKLPLYTPRDAQHSLERVIAACHAEPACKAAYPDIQGDVAAVMRRLEQGPVSVSVVDPRSGQIVDTPFTQEAFGSAMFFLLYIPEYYRQMPALVHAAAAGDFRGLVQAIAPVIVGTLDQVAWGLRWSVICSEDVARIDRGRIEALTAGTFLGDTPIAGDMAACDLWPKADIDDAYFEPFATDHPVLIISGTMDPVAPPRWGELMLESLPNAIHLPVKGASHMPVMPGCTQALVQAFLDGTPLAQLDSACAKASVVPSFVVTGGQGA